MNFRTSFSMKDGDNVVVASKAMPGYGDGVVSNAASKSGNFDYVKEAPPLHQQVSVRRVPENTRVHGQLPPKEGAASCHENVEPEEVPIRGSVTGKSGLLRTKTNSRLIDPPEETNHRFDAIKPPKSQLLGKPTTGIDEDDPFIEEDIPDEYKKLKLGVLSLIQLLSLLLIMALLICTLIIDFLKKIKLFDLDLWKWELMVLVLISGRLLSGWVIRVIVFLIERNFLLRKRVLYFVYGLRKSVQNCLWLSLVLISWQCIFDARVEKVTDRKILPYVTKTWVCLLIGTLVWLVKTLLVKVLASSFHMSTFFDRIQESLFDQYVIKTLSGPPLVEIQEEMEENDKVLIEVQKFQDIGVTIPSELKANVFPKSGRLIGTPRTSVFSKVMSKKEEENAISIDHLHRLNQGNISAWNMKRLMNIVRKGVLSTLDEKLQDATGKDYESEITSENRAIAAAKKIFNNVAKPGSKFIYKEDLLRFMQNDEVLKTMHLFEDVNDQQRISKVALKDWVVKAFRDRRALALSLNDTKTAVNKLHQVLNILIGAVIFCIWLIIMKVATTHFFIFMSSQLLVVVFMFGNTCKTTFEAIIFLFVVHPFDVGDRVEVDGVQMVVEEMNLLTTVFLRYDNNKIYYPNNILSTKPISNFYRSPDMGDSVDFCIHISTPSEKITQMKEMITSYVDGRGDHWKEGPKVVLKEVEDMNRLKYSLWVTHKMNHQDMGERWARRALLVEEMVKIFRDLDIEYRLLPIDVNVRQMAQFDSTRFPSNWTACA